MSGTSSGTARSTRTKKGGAQKAQEWLADLDIVGIAEGCSTAGRDIWGAEQTLDAMKKKEEATGGAGAEQIMLAAHLTVAKLARIVALSQL